MCVCACLCVIDLITCAAIWDVGIHNIYIYIFDITFTLNIYSICRKLYNDSVQCTLYDVHGTVYAVYGILKDVQCTMNIYKIHRTLYY